MSAPAGFEPIAEVTADERARIAFGKAGVRRNDRYLVSANAAGEIHMTPLASIPKRELIVWENEELRNSLLRGLAEASAGKVHHRDGYLDDGDDDE